MTNQAAQTMPIPDVGTLFGVLWRDDLTDDQVRSMSASLHKWMVAWANSHNTGNYAALSQTAGVAEGFVAIPKHYAENVGYAAAMLENSASVIDRHNAPALRDLMSLMLAAAPAASGVHPDALPDGTLSKSTAKRVEALASASVSERARECPACKGAGEVMQPVWTPDPQDGYDALGTCPRCGGNGSTFPQALQDLLYFTEHCLSAADEGVDYSTSREWLDAMTTMGVMKKTGRGKWAPSDQAQPVADALRAIEQALTQQRVESSVRIEDLGIHTPMRHAERADAEQAYSITAHDFEKNPIGSRDWTIYWRGWWHRSQLYTTPQPSADAVREVPDGMVLVPDRLTAENGAKAALSGEFYETTTITCWACDGEGYDDSGEKGVG